MIAAEKQLDSVQMMLVDDDESIITLLVDLFSNQQQLILQAYSDSAQAMEELRRQEFDIIITDLKMPNFTGMDILRAAREHNPRALVVLVTGFGSIETTLESIRLGAYDYLTKPFQIPEFEMKVHSAMRHVRMVRELEKLRAERKYLLQENKLLHQRLMELEEQVTQLEYRRTQEDRVLGPGRVPDASSAGGKSRTHNPYDTGPPQARERLRRELKKVDELRSQGVLNEEEHEQSKKQILQTYYT